jgi:hypothetical protein
MSQLLKSFRSPTRPVSVAKARVVQGPMTLAGPAALEMASRVERSGFGSKRRLNLP